MREEYKAKVIRMGTLYILHLPKELFFWMKNLWYRKGFHEKYPESDLFFSFSYEGKNVYFDLGDRGLNVVRVQYIGKPGAMSYRITIPHWVYYKLGRNLIFKALPEQGRILVMSDSCPE